MGPDQQVLVLGLSDDEYAAIPAAVPTTVTSNTFPLSTWVRSGPCLLRSARRRTDPTASRRCATGCSKSRLRKARHRRRERSRHARRPQTPTGLPRRLPPSARSSGRCGRPEESPLGRTALRRTGFEGSSRDCPSSTGRVGGPRTPTSCGRPSIRSKPWRLRGPRLSTGTSVCCRGPCGAGCPGGPGREACALAGVGAGCRSGLAGARANVSSQFPATDLFH